MIQHRLRYFEGFQEINLLWGLFFLLVLCGCKKEPPYNSKDWELIFSDEFSGSSLNRQTWKPGFPWGQNISDGDEQLFIDSAFSIKNGILHIELKRDTVIGNIWDHNGNSIQKKFYYTGGLMHTRESFSQQYGYFEIHARIPSGRGLWSAFWMGPYPDWFNEIDVFEIGGKSPGAMAMANHFRTISGEHRSNGFTLHGPDLSLGFHTYAVEWNPKEISWYLDDKKVFSTDKGIPNKKMFIILSLSIGGPIPGPTDNSTLLPASFEIDHIRVYRRK